MHVIVGTTSNGLAYAMTGRDRPEGMLINMYTAELKETWDGGLTISFEILDKDTDGVNVDDEVKPEDVWRPGFEVPGDCRPGLSYPG